MILKMRIISVRTLMPQPLGEQAVDVRLVRQVDAVARVARVVVRGRRLGRRRTAAVAAVLKSIYAHNKDSILQFQSTSLKERQIDFSNKSLIKTHLQLLVTIVDEYASAFWASSRAAALSAA